MLSCMLIKLLSPVRKVVRLPQSTVLKTRVGLNEILRTISSSFKFGQ